MFAKPTIADLRLARTRSRAPDARRREYQLYRQIYEHMSPRPGARTCDLLQASVNTLVSRVKKRGNPMENGLDDDYCASSRKPIRDTSTITPTARCSS